MENNELKVFIEDYINKQGAERQLIYSQNIHPYFMQVILNVMARMRVDLNRRDYEDLQQEAYYKLALNILSQECLKKVKNIKGYCYTITRNFIIDCMNKERTYGRRFPLLEEMLINESEQELLFPQV